MRSARSRPAKAVSGSDAETLRPTVDRIVRPAVEREAIPGLIVGISRGGRRSYFGYGAGDRPLAPDSVVEIGSITKVFTTALFAEAVLEGRMRPKTPMQAYLPNRSLRPCAQQVTPLQLADFRSGMPELPSDAPRALRERGIEHYTTEDFLAWVSRWSPADGSCNLPAPYRYSNASVGLLGLLVADQLGAPWEELVRVRITGPLGMASTAVSVPPDWRDRVAQGHTRTGAPAMPWPVFAWYAAGALRSTASDMLAFGEAALGHATVNGAPVPPSLGQALQRAMMPIYRPRGQPFQQGMAWAESPGDPAEGTRPLYYKDGGTDGFNSVIVVNPGKDLVIFIAADKADVGIQRLGTELSRQIR